MKAAADPPPFGIGHAGAEWAPAAAKPDMDRFWRPETKPPTVEAAARFASSFDRAGIWPEEIGPSKISIMLG